MASWKSVEEAPLDEYVLAFGKWRPSYAPHGIPRFAIWKRDSRDPDDFYSSDLNGMVTHWEWLDLGPEGEKMTVW